jgi:P4 family phage/plasmid primase-like protien
MTPQLPDIFTELAWFDGTHNLDGTERLDLETTRRLLPVNEVRAAEAISGICWDDAHPVRYVTQTRTWRRWDGSCYAAEHELGTALAEQFEYAYHQVLEAVRDKYDADAVEARRQELGGADPVTTGAGPAADAAFAQAMVPWTGPAGKPAQSYWAPHKSYHKILQTSAGMLNLIGQLTRTCRADEEKFDRYPGLIVGERQVIDAAATAANGYVTAWNPDPRLLVTKRLAPGLAYDPAAPCPEWDHFLATSVPDDAQRWWLCWRLANALAGLMPRKGWVNLIGEPDSGKSTFQAVVRALAGGYAGPVPVETFLSKHAGDAGFRQHELRGMRVVLTSEPPPGRRLDESMIKAVTGRDEQHTAGKNQPYVSWYPQCTIFIASNDPISYDTADPGSLARLEPVRFTRGYNVPDRWLLPRLLNELPGIFRSLMDTLAATAAARASGWSTEELPASMAALREDMADQTETSLRFLTEMVNEGHLTENKNLTQDHWVSTSQLYLLYQSWCEAEGIRQPDGRKTFSSKIGRRYPIARAPGLRRFSGLILPNANPLISH